MHPFSFQKQPDSMGKSAVSCSQVLTWTRIAVLLAVVLLAHTHARAEQTESGLSKDELQLINEAVVLMRGNSLIPPKSSGRMTEDILRAYTHFIDEYTDFLTSSEYTGFQESTSSDYFGVEMDLQKREGRIYLFPFRRGQAEKKGVRAGDELIAVNGAPVFGKSVFLVGSHIRGEEGSTVQLTTRTANGIPRVVTLRRERARFNPVTLSPLGDYNLIEISRFSNNTAEMLKQTLDAIAGEQNNIIIDLRQNQGGNLQEAIKSADLFVEPDALLFRLRSRTETRDILAESLPITRAKVLLLQDGSTASAAEAFIIALTHDGRAVSAGLKSFGKGLAQRFLPLSDGSALVLTYAEILGPDNSPINEKGLLPDILLPAELMHEDFRNDESMRKLLELTGIEQK